MTTVAELIEVLKNYSGDMPVILSSDAEGNDYSLLYEYGSGTFDPDEVRGSEKTKSFKALVLWPC